MSFERWNTHFSTVVEQEVFGVDFKLAQDPNSHNLGTTVWDASIVLAKFLEKNAKRGDLSRARAKGRRCLELGSGMGLGGLAFALLGADITLSDLAPVLPLLERNYQANLAPAVLRVGDSPWAAEVVGRVSVQELDWACPAHYAAFSPPYDYILAADCVYSELAVPHFLATVLHMSDVRSTVVVVNEFRSQSVHHTFMAAFQPHFTLKQVPPSKMDPHYQHPLIHIYICKRRKHPLPDPPPSAAALCTALQGEPMQGEDHSSQSVQSAAADDSAALSGRGGPPVEQAPGVKQSAAAVQPFAEAVQVAEAVRAVELLVLRDRARDVMPRESAVQPVPAAQEAKVDQDQGGSSTGGTQRLQKGVGAQYGCQFAIQHETEAGGALLPDTVPVYGGQWAPQNGQQQLSVQQLCEELPPRRQRHTMQHSTK